MSLNIPQHDRSPSVSLWKKQKTQTHAQQKQHILESPARKKHTHTHTHITTRKPVGEAETLKTKQNDAPESGWSKWGCRCRAPHLPQEDMETHVRTSDLEGKAPMWLSCAFGCMFQGTKERMDGWMDGWVREPAPCRPRLGPGRPNKLVPGVSMTL